MLCIGIFTARPERGGTLLLDATIAARNVRWSWNQHGPERCEFELPRGIADALRLFAAAGALHLVVADGGVAVWEGRIEDPELWLDEAESGLSVVALGYWRALGDLPYTALWSEASIADFKTWPDNLTGLAANRVPQKFAFDTDAATNRLYISLQKNTNYLANEEGGQIYWPPASGSRSIAYISASYRLRLPLNFVAAVYTFGADYSTFTSAWSVVATGSATPQTGTIAAPVSPTRDGPLTFSVYNASGVTYGNVQENGYWFAELTNVRFTTSGVNIYADEIMRDLVATIAAANPGQISSNTSLIRSPLVDMKNVRYEDQNMADAADALAAAGDNSSAVQLYEVGVALGGFVYFRPKGSAGRTWYGVPAGRTTVQRSLDQLYNSAYATYQESGGRTLRTATSTDSASTARYGITRRLRVETQTTSSSEAVAARDARLNDTRDPLPRATIPVEAIADAYGQRYPLHAVRPGDTFVIGPLPASASTTIDRVRSFRVSRCEYNADDDTLEIEPEPMPSMAVVPARTFVQPGNKTGRRG